MAITVSELWIYPVKGMRGVRVSERDVDATGLRGDRRFVLIGDNNRFLTQRECPGLARIDARHDEKEGISVLRLGTISAATNRYHEIGAVDVEALNRTSGEQYKTTVSIWHDTVEAILIRRKFGNAIDRSMSAILERPVRLAYLPDWSVRPSRGQLPGTSDVRTSFADGYPFLVTSAESLADLNRRLADKKEDGIPMDRFRPSIVVGGCDEPVKGRDKPFEEDSWVEFQIGDVTFHGMKRCGRCGVTTTNQDTGGRMGKEPLETLEEYRRFGKDVCFGLYANHANPGTIRVGDEVRVIRRGKLPKSNGELRSQ